MATTAENRAARAARNLAERNAKLVSFNAIKVIKTSDGSTREVMRMTRRWPRIDDKNRVALETYLRANTYITSPMADGEKRAGRWRSVRVFSSPLKTAEAEQGIYQILVYWPENYGEFGDFAAAALSSTISASVSHAPHALHCPCHFE